MLSLKKLVQKSNNWQRIAALGRKRLHTKLPYEERDQSTSLHAEKGHFVLYTADGKRFVIPLDYLNTRIVMQLFQLSEEEFGYTVDGPITLPCEGAFMEYTLGLIKKGMSEEVERALLNSVLLPHHHACSMQSNSEAISQQVELCSF
ncbi:hypothetical protein LUZ63_009724 [Rhynchospora breviuscula]|uniref:Uncharacterized protein n=1 Tax=Rhynchospora breviuscula TaxID=2022672 RepID=A0A9Q0HNW0_9POAL|nr:hypothetical protein LUZ63_009724 [Rhynchospora breviuscula]